MEDKSLKKELSQWFWAIVLLIGVIIIAALPFHYLPDHMMVFPKENFTFSNTFVFQSDVNNLINRYNNASFIEKISMRKDPLVRKLMEKGIIREENNSDSYNSDNYSSKREDYSNQSYSEEIIFVTAKTLFSDYEENTVAADKKYKNKTLKVEGIVSGISSNYNGISMYLGYWWDWQQIWVHHVECYFSERFSDEISRVKKNQKITIQGKCMGKEYGYVELKGCSIIQNQSEKESKNSNLNFLRDFKGKYPYEVKLFEKTEFSQRLKNLLCDRYEFLIDNWHVQTPMKINDDLFITEACQTHNCGYLGTGAIIVYDFSNDVIYVGIREEGEVEIYSESGKKSLIITEWANDR